MAVPRARRAWETWAKRGGRRILPQAPRWRASSCRSWGSRCCPRASAGAGARASFVISLRVCGLSLPVIRLYGAIRVCGLSLPVMQPFDAGIKLLAACPLIAPSFPPRLPRHEYERHVSFASDTCPSRATHVARNTCQKAPAQLLARAMLALQQPASVVTI